MSSKPAGCLSENRRVFVSNISNDEIDGDMVRSINQVDHVMGISAIAEFVEDE